jgi:SHS family lactate transporter-like MFS transporter
MRIEALSGWTPAQRHVVLASYLGWTLDAFDFFLLVFMFKAIRAEFAAPEGVTELAATLTLGARPIGALLFGRAADRWGRRPTLMVNVVLYSLLDFVSGFSPNITTLLILRALFGVAMGGEWGVGASLTMESIPPKARGLVSGLLQSGYPSGYLLASIVFYLLYDHIGWRGMFFVGAAPALLVLYIRRNVPESPGWEQRTEKRGAILEILQKHWKLALYAVLLMTAFNFFSHGTQDGFPSHFLTDQLGLGTAEVGRTMIIFNIGAICGGLSFGAVSERLGRRWTIITAALLSILAVYFVTNTTDIVTITIGAFLQQFMVQGAWGIIPVHLNELSPDGVRGTFPGFVYQLGNFIASWNLNLQVIIAGAFAGHFSTAILIVGGASAATIALLTFLGPERKGAVLA